MPTTSDPSGPDGPATRYERRWAMKQLNLKDSLSSKEQHSEALHYLAAEEYSLYAEDDLAVRILASPSLDRRQSSDRVFLRQLEERACREKLKNYCQEFYTLPVQQRAMQFQQLAKRCRSFLPLRRQLMHLKKGLWVVPGALRNADARVQTLGEMILDLFPLFPLERARLQRERLQPLQKTPHAWKKAARSLTSQFPDIAELGGDWFEKLTESPVFAWRQLSLRNRWLRPPQWMKISGQVSSDNHTDSTPLFSRKVLICGFGGGIVAAILLALLTGPQPRNFSPQPSPPATSQRPPVPSLPERLKAIQSMHEQIQNGLREQQSQIDSSLMPPVPMPPMPLPQGPFPRRENVPDRSPATREIQSFLESVRKSRRVPRHTPQNASPGKQSETPSLPE